MAKYVVVKEIVQSYQVEVEANSPEEARQLAAAGRHRDIVPVRGRRADVNLNPSEWPAIEKELSGGLFNCRWPSEPPPKPADMPGIRRVAA